MNTRALLAVVVILAIATPALSKELFHRKSHPTTWERQVRADGARPVKFTVALPQRNLDLLNDAFEAISTPGSPFYRQFLTTEEVQRLVAPAPAHKAAVLSWLKNNEVEEWQITDLSDALTVRTTVAVAEKLFATEMFMFKHKASGKRIARQYGRMAVPASVADAIEMVEGLSGFPVLRETMVKKNAAPRKEEAITGTPAIVPETIQASYGTPASSSPPAGNHGLGVIEFEGQSFAPSDLSDWSTQTGISIPALAAANIIGPNDPTNTGTESTLDIDMTATVAKDVDQWFILYGGDAWLYTFTSEFNAMTKYPSVVSVSYGWSEADQCESGIGGTECSQLGVNTFQFVARVNAEFQKVGVRGTSVFVASGDSGANGRTDGGCTESQLFPSYPAASPFVTAVGATQLNNPIGLTTTAPVCNNGQWGCLAGGQEVAVSYAVAGFASGGGFSNVAPTPSYQAAAVKNYLNTNKALPPASYFNNTGRGFPDVAAFGSAILIDQSLSVQSVGGTSAASPIWAAVASLLNSEAIALDGKPLGFLNPLLYKIAEESPESFTDITVGDNICTEQGCASTCVGFTAQAGWDPVTGLGSPVYPNLLKYIKNNL